MIVTGGLSIHQRREVLAYYAQMCKARLFSKQVVTITKVPVKEHHPTGFGAWVAWYPL